jgi:hypothetical protein
VAAPVIDHVLPVVVFTRQPSAFVEVMIWAGTACVTAILLASVVVVAVILLPVALWLVIMVIAISRPLGEGKSTGDQRNGNEGGYKGFSVYAVLLRIGATSAREYDVRFAQMRNYAVGSNACGNGLTRTVRRSPVPTADRVSG